MAIDFASGDSLTRTSAAVTVPPFSTSLLINADDNTFTPFLTQAAMGES